VRLFRHAACRGDGPEDDRRAQSSVAGRRRPACAAPGAACRRAGLLRRAVGWSPAAGRPSARPPATAVARRDSRLRACDRESARCTRRAQARADEPAGVVPARVTSPSGSAPRRACRTCSRAARPTAGGGAPFELVETDHTRRRDAQRATIGDQPTRIRFRHVPIGYRSVAFRKGPLRATGRGGPGGPRLVTRVRVRTALRTKFAAAGLALASATAVLVGVAPSATAAASPKPGGSVVYGLEAETGGGWCPPTARLAISGIEVGDLRHLRCRTPRTRWSVPGQSVTPRLHRG
jgi:hypothetical protein